MHALLVVASSLAHLVHRGRIAAETTKNVTADVAESADAEIITSIRIREFA